MVESSELPQMAEIERLLASMYTEEEAERWWDSPHPRFGGETPDNLVIAGRIGELLDSLRALDECVYI